MRKTKMYVSTLVLGVMLFGSASAFAAGYPFAVATTSGSTKAIVLGKFASDQFSQAEAQALTVSVAGIIQSFLASSNPTVLTPSQMAAYDADTWKTMVKSNYKAWGFSSYIFVNITKTPEHVAGFGPNLRLDIFIADMASLVGVQADYLYAASIEVPYMYTPLLNSF